MDRPNGGGGWVLPMSPTATHIHASGPIFLVASAGDAAAGGLPVFAQQLFRSQSGRNLAKRGLLAGSGGARRGGGGGRVRPLFLAALLTLGLLSFFEPHVRGGLELALLRARWGMGGAPPAHPPRGLDFPVQSCCVGEQCVRNSKGRHAVVTHVRSQREVTQLQALEASVRRSNPGVDLAVMLVRGELGAAATRRLLGMNVTTFYVEPLRDALRGADARPGSASANWLKLRAFGLSQYDAVLLVDSNAYVSGDLAPLFALPTDFAAGWDQARWLGLAGSTATAVRSGAGGGLFLRPCATTEAHMLEVLRRQGQPPRLPRALALGLGAGEAQQGGGSSGGSGGDDWAPASPEQEFLAWYFQHSGLSLPFDVYVINLDTQASRLAAFQQSFQASDLRAKNVVRFPAVNGSALDAGRLVTPKAQEEITSAAEHGFRTKHYQLTQGSLGCYLSHLQLYQHIVRSGAQYAFVFEDDATLAPDLLAQLVEAKPFPEDWDLILLGHYCRDCPRVPAAPHYRSARAFFGTHGYVVHRRGLQKIFGYPRLYPIEKQIDAVLGDMCVAGLLNVYALDSPAVDQNSRQFQTTIQVPVKRRMGVNPYASE